MTKIHISKEVITELVQNAFIGPAEAKAADPKTIEQIRQLEINDIKDLLWNNLREIHTRGGTAMVDLKTKALENEERELEAKKIETPNAEANEETPTRFDWTYSETAIEKLATTHNTFVSDLITRQLELEPFKECAAKIIARTNLTIQAFHALSLTEKDLQDILIVANKYRDLLQSKMISFYQLRDYKNFSLSAPYRSEMKVTDKELKEAIRELTNQEQIPIESHNLYLDDWKSFRESWKMNLNSAASEAIQHWKDKLNQEKSPPWNARLLRASQNKDVAAELQKASDELSFIVQKQGSDQFVTECPQICQKNDDLYCIYQLGEEMARLFNQKAHDAIELGALKHNDSDA
jgi:hypothetical protein